MKKMAYLVLMLSRSPLLKTSNHFFHRLIPSSYNVYEPAQEIKTQQGMQIEISYLKATYLTDQGMLRWMIHEHTHQWKMNQELYINGKEGEAYNKALMLIGSP